MTRRKDKIKEHQKTKQNKTKNQELVQYKKDALKNKYIYFSFYFLP